MRIAAITLLGGLFLLAQAQDTSDRTILIVGTVYTGTGEVYSPGYIVMEDGRITHVGAGDRAPVAGTIVEARDRVAIPGLVAAYTTFAGAEDDVRTIASDVRAVDGLPMRSDRWVRALEGGVTTLYVTPGSSRLVAGQGVVVKAGQWAEVIHASFGLKVTFGQSSLNPPTIYEPPVPPTAEQPFRPAERQYPVTRMAQVAELRRAIRDAHNPLPEWDAERDNTLPLVEVRRGQRPLVIEASRADDIVRAVMIAEEFGAHVVIVGAEEAAEVSDYLAARSVPIVFNPRVGLGEQPDPVADAVRGRPSASAAARLIAAGVPLAIQPQGSMEDLLFLAGWLVRHGLEPAAALRALTIGPAEMIGVADRVGTLEPGKDADVVLLSGDPFHPASVAMEVYVGGQLMYTREALRRPGARLEDGIAGTAYRVRRIHPGGRMPIENGLVVVHEGKFTYVGAAPEEIPAGLTVVDVPDGVMLPGFINAGGIEGLPLRVGELAAWRGAQFVVPTNQAIPIAGALREPAAEALRMGVTTVLISPAGRSVASLVRLSPDGAPEVLREVAAVRFGASAGTSGREALRNLLRRAKEYHDQWTQWEERQNQPPPAPAPQPAEGDPITGVWEGTVDLTEYGMQFPVRITLTRSGETVTGTYVNPQTGTQYDLNGTWDGTEMRFHISQEGSEGDIVLRLEEPDHLRGTFSLTYNGQHVTGNLDLRRQSAAQAQQAAAAAPQPQEPRRDPTLEPFRPLFRGEIPALVDAVDAPSLEAVRDIVGGEFHVRYILVDPRDAAFDAAGLALGSEGAIFHAGFVFEHLGRPYNAAEVLTRYDVPVAFATGGMDRGDLLPLLAAYGRRHGLEDWEVYESLAYAPAEMLGVSDRVGAIAYGRDADFVIFHGEPLDFRSRVAAVVVGGRSVVQE